MSNPSEARPSRHSAVLLADGRVLFGGPSRVMEGGASFEVFSPPYLFRGLRPSLRRAPAGVAWDEPFKVSTPDAGDIEAVVLTRLPSPQHGADSDGRTLLLDFSRTDSGELTVQAPPNGVAAPPGYYYLFVFRSSLAGPIPSVARIVHLAATADPGDAPRPFPDNAPAPAPTAGEGEPGSGPGAFSGRVRG